MSVQVERKRLLEDMDQARRELSRAMEDLRDAARDRVDLRRRMARNPVPWLVGGFLVGLWLGWRR